MKNIIALLLLLTQSIAFAGFGPIGGGGGGSGTVTSVALTAPNILSVSGSPVTSSGTLALSLATQSANIVFAGPTSGGAATPTFRSLVASDIPSLSSVYLPLAGGTLVGNLIGTYMRMGTGSQHFVSGITGYSEWSGNTQEFYMGIDAGNSDFAEFGWYDGTTVIRFMKPSSSAKYINFGTGNPGALQFNTPATNTVHLLWLTPNVSDIGGTGNYPRDIWVGRNIYLGNVQTATLVTTVVGVQEVFNVATGASLGYVPIYQGFTP